MALAACGPPLAQISPARARAEIQQTVRTYLEAIYAGDARRAWALHSRETTAGERFEDFAQAVRITAAQRNRVEIERIGEPHVDGARATVEVVQRLDGRASGYRFTLVFEDGRWRIHNPRPPASTR